jgi:transcriptional regulator with XRE-family HTH domain
MKIGEHIKEIRVLKGLTQVELSERSGIALRTIQRIEKGDVNPSIFSLKAIGAILEVNLNELVLKESDKKFEFKVVVSNVDNLIEDSKALFRRNWRILLFLISVVTFFASFSTIKSLVLNIWDDSKVTVASLNCGSANECDIVLTKKDAGGKILWERILGGNSYDKATQVLKTKEGDYLVLGSTSSFGKGNYDVLVVKVSSSGDILWQNTYGEFLNDYGVKISLTDDNLYLIEATKQICKTVNVSNDCINQEWLFRIDGEGNVK